jgi:hypothetical protein
MEKEWANKDKYHPSNGVLEPRVQLPRAKASVRSVRAWGERKAVGGAAAQATPVRPVRGTGQTGAGLDRQQFGFHAQYGYGRIRSFEKERREGMSVRNMVPTLTSSKRRGLSLNGRC